MTEPTDSIDGLSPQETAAIAALMTAPSIEQTAAQVGIHERTLRRWLSKDHFKRALRAEQRAVMACVTARLHQSAEKAVQTLEAIMADEKAPHASRVTAARTLLELAQERIDMEHLTERVEAVEHARGRLQ